MNIIWQGCFNFKYKCFVCKLTENEGTLHIEEILTNKIIHTEPVKITKDLHNESQNWQQTIHKFFGIPT